jgi:hypothetical protein
VISGQNWGDGRQALRFRLLRAGHCKKLHQAREVLGRFERYGALAGADRSARAPLPQEQLEGGRHPYPMAKMLRIHLMQQLYSHNDPGMEEALIEVPTIRRFVGIDMISDQILIRIRS